MDWYCHMSYLTQKQVFSFCRCHTKRKLGWYHWALPSLLLVGHRLQDCTLLWSQITFYSRSHIKWRLGWGGVKQAYFWYDKDLNTCLCATWLIYRRTRSSGCTQLMVYPQSNVLIILEHRLFSNDQHSVSCRYSLSALGSGSSSIRTARILSALNTASLQQCLK